MARQLRIEYEGAIYHVTCRMLGDARSILFRDDKARWRFLEQLCERVEKYNIRLYMFVLMRNHFHLVFETPAGNCSAFMQSLLTAYTVYYNIRHRRHGHLFDGRYKAKVVEGNSSTTVGPGGAGDYLLALSRYVHLNPVRVGEIKSQPVKERIELLRQYQWSSYQSYVGRRKELPFVDYGPTLEEFQGKKGQKRRRYREFVESGIAQNDEEFMEALKESRQGIGGDEFRAWVDDLYQGLIQGRKSPEDVSYRRTMAALDSERVLEVLADVFEVKVGEFRKRLRNSPLRAVASHYLLEYAGLSQREIARCLGVSSGGAISKQLVRYSELLATDKNLTKLCQRAEVLLSKEG